MRENKTKTVYLKHAVIGPKEAAGSLSQLLWQALAARSTIGSRRQALGQSEEESEWLVIGHYSGTAQNVACALVRYSPGSAAAAILDDLEANQATFTPVKAPAKGQMSREFVEGMLLFVAIGNQLVMMQSPSVRQRSLENHLFWLLRDADCLSEGQALSLEDRATPAAIEAASKSPVRSIELAAAFDPTTQQKRRKTISEHALGSLQAMFGGNADLPLDVLDQSKVGVSVQLKYEGRRHEAPAAMLDQLSRSLRHADGVDVVVTLDDGSTIVNERLRTSGKVQIATDDGLPSLNDAFTSMRQWLSQRQGG